MDQMSLFNIPAFPASYDDVDSLYREYIYEGETDEDAFTWSEIKDGRTYSFYGQKVFEFFPGADGKAKLKLPGRIMKQLDDKKSGAKDDAFYALQERAISPVILVHLMEILQKEKRIIFRNTITEKFACCHAFRECSNKGECLFPDDRFFNGCEYRKNLEAGRNFYRED
ncbi:MAG: hypothetical protein K5919_05075 [Clostridiales bacterium]|nr:hypothetical protein [Clostridiales bacterium]